MFSLLAMLVIPIFAVGVFLMCFGFDQLYNSYTKGKDVGQIDKSEKLAHDLFSFS